MAAKDGRTTGDKCMRHVRKLQKRAKLTKHNAIAAAARGPTSPQLGVRALSCDADADGCVGIVAVVVLATLAGTVEAEAPTSLVAIVALDVEARPRGTDHNRSSSKNSQSNGSRNRCLPRANMQFTSLASAWDSPGRIPLQGRTS